MKHNVTIRLISVLLTLLLLLPVCPTVLAAENRVSIGTLEELADFAKRCSSDAYSKGLSVVLTADLDAAGAELSIPIFLGTFDGQGHCITGLQLTQSNSPSGLFSRIEAGAVVKNLSVEGKIQPAGTQRSVGGIVGENSGTLESCDFSGVVLGSDDVGGIAGRNETGGSITNCTVSGIVRGTQFTGGIVGENAGTILRCTSAASVNTTVTEEDISAAELENLENTLYSILKKEEATETAVTTDTGGIAGYSTGIVQSCTNTGAVGYPHVGYNVGGIAGRQNGYLASCVNRGFVQGRKDVGGIIGQMAPDVTLQFSSDGLDELQTELSALQTCIDHTLDDTQSASDGITDRISNISDYAGSARESAFAITEQAESFVNDNLSAVNDTLLLAERYLDQSAPIMEDLSAASENAAEAVRALRELWAQMDDLAEDSDQLLSQLQDFCTEIKATCDALETAMDRPENAFSLLEKGPAKPDTQPLRNDLAALREAADTLETAVSRALEELEAGGTLTPETRAQIRTSVTAVLDGYVAVLRDAADLIVNTDWGALRDENLETIRQVATELSAAMQAFASGVSHFGNAMERLGEALQTMRSLASELEPILADLDAVLAPVQQASAALADAFSGIAQWASSLSKEEPISFSPLSSDFDAASSALNSSLGGIGNELSALNQELSSANASLLSDIRAINNQFMKVMNLFLNLLNGTQDLDYTDLFEDVSEKSLQSATRGKALECINYGEVCADRNVGGIAGSMAIEYDLDPEDDLLSSDNRSLHFTYQTKAILLDCKNYGSVTAKKSCAGGIAGRMDLGTISGCGGWGDTSSESGDYVGGVAGLSLSSIRDSDAKCTLSGGKYVGGIAGSGNRVSDCLSMVAIADCTQFGGAVAGEITGECSKNQFVSDDLAGIDRVSLSGQAEPISYSALCKKKGISKEFRTLTLSFVADGKTLKEQEFQYGDSFSADCYPTPPEKDGCFVRWDRTNLTQLHFDTVVTATYEPYVTTLASASTQDGHASLLVEGTFSADDKLQASLEPAPASFSETALETWKLRIPEDGQKSHTVRWRLPNDGKFAVYTGGEDAWTKVSSNVIGSYLCFELENSDQFTVISVSSAMRWVWVALAGGVAILGILFFIGIRRRKNRTTKRKHG